MIRTGLVALLLLAVTTYADQTQPASASAKQQPQYSFLSYLSGLIVMLVFVVTPVGMMAYRNRNSIVEFIKNR